MGLREEINGLLFESQRVREYRSKNAWKVLLFVENLRGGTVHSFYTLHSALGVKANYQLNFKDQHHLLFIMEKLKYTVQPREKTSSRKEVDSRISRSTFRLNDFDTTYSLASINASSSSRELQLNDYVDYDITSTSIISKL
jgi:hypothetical protein